jgi:imidazolonepropionase-like amidohydrolase
MRKILLSSFLFYFILGQTKPVTGIHENNPRVWALSHAKIHTEPGDSIKDGTIIIRDGKIEKVGRYIKIPTDAYEIDLEGAHVYAGFIDGWLEVKREKKDISPDDHWNQKIHADYRAKNDLKIKSKDLKSLKSIGITAAQVIPEKGIFKGQTDLILLDEDFTSLKPSIAQVIEFKSGGWSDRSYPNSLLGVIALIRQTLLDAEWYGKSIDLIEEFPEQNEPIKYNPSLSQIDNFRKNQKPILFKAKEEHAVLRALNISKEYNLNPWIMGSGFEYRRLESIVPQKPFFIFSLNFPSKPKVLDPYLAHQYSTEQLKHWDMAPDNIKKVYDSGLLFNLTSSQLKTKLEFRKNLQKIIDRGLPKDVAHAALTTFPAEAMGMEKVLGRIQPGYMANLVVTDGDYFNPKSRITSLWINGVDHFIAPRHISDIKGDWALNIGGKDLKLNFATQKAKKETQNPPKKSNKVKGLIDFNGETLKIQNLEVSESFISFTVEATKLGFKGTLAFNGQLESNIIRGSANDGSNQLYPFSAKKTSKSEKKPRTQSSPSDLKVFYPEGAYGLTKTPVTPNAVLINDATLWTCGPKGVLEDWDILFIDGIIDKIAPDITVPKGSAIIIDAMGKHVTPGLIDCHSHSAASSINEGAQAVTAEVRIKDVLYADDINIYRQLGGGLTTANVLHGSANPIGGQNAVIKLKWGSGPNDLLYKNAPQGIKFALGENVKQANWEGNGRYPQTRMGVEQIIRDAFRAAQDYRHAHKTYNRSSTAQRKKVPPRTDLELEALAEILEGTRLLHCHSYRQDEILMLTRIAEDFGFTIATFQHVLEGYKVADRLYEHGAGASTFSDWWQYKYEVIDAIPYNGSLMAKNGVLVSFNSDDAELARRMNTEAAKAIKYGELSEEKALKFITINPAKQLKIDKWVGSLEEGKDADFVIWDGPPLSIYSKVQETWIEGSRYFSTDENKLLEKRDQELRSNLIQKVLSSSSSIGHEMKPNSESPKRAHNCEIDDSELF